MAVKKASKKSAAKSAPVAAEVAPLVIAYKGFDSALKCRDFQYEVGKTYTHDGEVKACNSGFHACENPLDVFSYYAPAQSRFALVELGGELSSESGGDTKVASGRIAVKAELRIPEVVTAAIAWITALTKPEGSNHATGYQSASSATGYGSASSATGYGSASSATGDRSASSATGDRSASSATGYQSASSATGYGSVAMSIGYQSRSSAGEGGAIVCVYRDSDFNLVHIRASKVGDNGIKPDTFYTLNASGEFVEAA